MTWGLCFLSSMLATSQPHVATEIYICQNQMQLNSFPLVVLPALSGHNHTVVVPMATVLKNILSLKEQ